MFCCTRARLDSQPRVAAPVPTAGDNLMFRKRVWLVASTAMMVLAVCDQYAKVQGGIPISELSIAAHGRVLTSGCLNGIMCALALRVMIVGVRV